MKGFWVISDTHFFHSKIIEYTNRPFESVEHMNKVLVRNWNELISQDDIVYHLGDFAMGKENVAELVQQLNGKIILIIGNHDRKGKQWFRGQGFLEVYNEFTIGNFLLTHKPKKEGLPNDMINLHGHLHGIETDLNLDKYIDCSCENTNYSPLWIKLDKS